MLSKSDDLDFDLSRSLKFNDRFGIYMVSLILYDIKAFTIGSNDIERVL